MSSNIICVEKKLLQSKAFRSLKSATYIGIYSDFLIKRKMSKVNRKRGASWYITNNGKIVYTYSEAEKKGYSRALFARALTALVEHGLIDIIKQGGGSKGDISLYAISERWVKYGTKDFEHKTRKKDTREGRGWAAFHSKQKKKSTTPETLSSKKVRPLVPKKIIKKRKLKSI